jgi:hypothetical protein
VGGALEDVIAPPPGELFSETNDNSVAFLLSYGTTGVLLVGTPKPGRRNSWLEVRTRDLKRSSTFRNYTHSEPMFRALLTEGASEVKLALS